MMADSQKKILIVGAGSIGERHVRCFQATGRAEVGVCENSVPRLEEVAERYGVADSFADLSRATEQVWDAAVIATPAHTHIPIASSLAEQSFHLLIEKPLTTSMDGVNRLIETVRERDLTVGVAYVYRAHPGVAWMREALESGRFGKPLQLVVNSGQHFPLYRPAYRDIYFARHDLGGGAIQDGITHFLNLGEYLCGPITALSVDAAHQSLEGVEVEDTVHALCRHGESGDVMGSYSYNQFQAPNESTVTVACEAGTVRFELLKNRILWMTEPGAEWTVEDLPTMERDDWFISQANRFLNALEGSEDPLCSLEEGAQSAKATLAALRMYLDGNGLERL